MYAGLGRCMRRQQDDAGPALSSMLVPSAPACARMRVPGRCLVPSSGSGSAGTATVTSVGGTSFSIVSLVTTHLRHVAARGELELDLEQDLLDDRAQPARAGLALERLVGDRRQRVVGEDELDAIELEEALELLDERVARLGQDQHQLVAGELVDRRHHG